MDTFHFFYEKFLRAVNRNALFREKFIVSLECGGSYIMKFGLIIDGFWPFSVLKRLFLLLSEMDYR